jgi:hypothetical protein
VKGRGLVEALAGHVARFVVILRDAEGKRLRKPDVNIQVRL